MLLAFFALSCKPEATLVDGGSDPLINFEVHHLQPIHPGAGHYEAWISFSKGLPEKRSAIEHGESSFVSIGKFNVDSLGHLRSLDGSNFIPRFAQSKNLQYMSDAIVTIEAEGDSAELPGPAIMGGAFSGDIRIGAAELSTGYGDALGANFDVAEASYLLATPTSADTADSASGIWFMSSVAPPTAGLLQLPRLGAGWRYEGWVRTCCVGAPDDRGYVNFTTGTFKTAEGYDVDSAGGRRGPSGQGYPFPGQDFTGVKRLLLNDDTFEVMITIEPIPDNSPEPFEQLTLFPPAKIPPTLPPGISRTMKNGSSVFPTGRISIVR